MMRLPPVMTEPEVQPGQIKDSSSNVLPQCHHPPEVFSLFDGRLKVCMRFCDLVNLMSNFVIPDPATRWLDASGSWLHDAGSRIKQWEAAYHHQFRSQSLPHGDASPFGESLPRADSLSLWGSCSFSSGLTISHLLSTTHINTDKRWRPLLDAAQIWSSHGRTALEWLSSGL